ncbi:MAG TPA: bifunctional riboflavin kinase/FAD synthetase [Dehalococcoidia bacterium]|nr:bifunctional riboflavin kinase/FAD synthetase [Dehalococcoidia bacterium]
MLLSRDELRRNAPGRPCAVTVGVFDGVHLGHRHLIDALRERAAARGLASAVVTLHPDPVQVLRPDVRISYLTSLEERVELLRATGVDAVAPLTFTSEVAELSAAEFVGMLVDTLDMRFVLMGPDHAFGRGREGTPARVAEIGESLGFEVEVLPEPLAGTSGAVSATAIRRALAEGDMELVAQLLGRPFALRGPVVRGHERGRGIGFPTANIAVTADRALPAFGVYVTRATAGGRTYHSATNIGVNPTFGDERPSVETYILDFEGDLYGRELRIEVLHRLRGEEKFGDVGALTAAIGRDVEATRAFFAAAGGS